eukprot:s2849_g11.t1
MCSVAYAEQQRNGRNATLEHPWPSRAWATKALKKIEPGSYDTYVDQCQYGLQLPDKHGQLGPVKKPTCFRTTRYNLKVALECSCPGDHNHVPLEGNIPGGGGPRSKAAESYPQALAEALAAAMLVKTDGDIVMAAADDSPAGALDLAQGDLNLSPEVPHEGAVDLDLAPEPAENVTKNKALKAAVGNQVFSYVARLHKNLGHPSPEVLQRMLTEVQATEDVLKALCGSTSQEPRSSLS